VAVAVIRDSISGRSFTGELGHRMYIYAETTGTLTLSVPYAPVEIAYDGLVQDWTEVDRSGAKPLLMRKGDNLLTMKFSLRLANVDAFYAQTGNIATIRQLAKSRERVLVRYGPNEAGLWRITECSVSSDKRHPDTNEITDSVASFTFTEASDAAPAVGPVRPPAPKPKPVTAKPKRKQRVYVVKKGDCLWKIAQRYYGRGALWPRIYDANRKQIKNPHWIYPGQRFVIP
jgi:LysM repeat protein